MNELIAHAAGILINASMIPQLYKTWKTRDTSGLSRTRYIIYLVALSLWLYYGFAIDNTPMIIANATGVTLASALLVMILLFNRNAGAEL